MGLLDGYPGLGAGGNIDLSQLVRPPDPLGAALGEISQRLAVAGQASRLPVSTLGALGSALGGASTAAQTAQTQYLDQAIKLQALRKSLAQAGIDERLAPVLFKALQGGGALPGAAPGAAPTPAVPGVLPGAAPVAPVAAAPAAAPAALRPTLLPGDVGAGGEYGAGQGSGAPPDFAGFTPSNLPPGSPGTVTIDGKTYTRSGAARMQRTSLLGDPGGGLLADPGGTVDPRTGGDLLLPDQGGPAAGVTQASFRPASLVGPAGAGNGAGVDPASLAGLLAPDDKAPADPLAGLLATDAPIRPGGPDTLVRDESRSQLPAELASMSAPRSEADIVKSESGGNPYIGYRGVDLTNAPRDPETGFPQWEGRMGPAGISHAAGIYQFQPGTYAEGAKALGIKDFSPESQKAVYDWTRAKYGDAPWRASEGGARPGMMLAQYAPGGGGAAGVPDAQAVINGLMQQRATSTTGGVIPGLNMTPQQVAAFNALSSLAGHTGSPLKEFLDIYYKDPQYLQDAARAGELGKAQVGLQYGPLTAGLTAGAQAAAQQPYELQKIFGKTQAELAAEWDKPQRVVFTDAQGNPHEQFISPRQLAGGAPPGVLGTGTQGTGGQGASPPPLTGPQTGLGPIGQARVELDKGMATSAAQTAATGQQLAPILDEIIRIADKTPQGMAGPIGAAMAARLAPFFPVSESLTNAELMRSLTQQLIPTVRQPGAQSNKEMEVYQLAVPGLMQSAIGRAQIANINKAMINRASDIAAIRRDNIGAPDLSQKLGEIDNKPLFSDQQRAIMQAGTGRPIDKAAYDLLPPGMLYTDPMGTKRTKPAAP